MADQKADTVSTPSDFKRSSLVSELKDDDSEMSLEEQLALVEKKLIDEDNVAGEQTEDDKSTVSEESDETDASKADTESTTAVREQVKEEVTLQMRLARLEAENAELRAQKQSSEKTEDEDIDLNEIDFDIGELDEAYDGIREPLNRVGKLLIAENMRLDKEVKGLKDYITKWQQRQDVETVKEKLEIDDSEEKAIADWVEKNGLSFNDRKSLVNVVRLYRNEQELNTLKEEKTKRGKRNSNPPSATRKSTSSRTEPEVRKGKSLEDHFDRNVDKINEELARGRRY